MTQPELEESPNGEVESEIAGIEDIEALKEALASEKKKSEDHLANWQRAQADFINYKRRAEQERGEFAKYANAALILGLLPILDDLERAFDATPSKQAKPKWVEGIRLIERKFRASLETQGLAQIKALGEPFDPYFHEAIRQDNGKEGIIIEEIQKGYLLNDRLLRPSKVVVGTGEEVEKEE